MSAITVTGIVERCELKSRTPFKVSRYAVGEKLEYYLDVCLRLADGSAVYFCTVAATRTVASCPGAAIVVFDTYGEASKWMKEEGDIKVAVPGQSNNNKLVPLIHVGDSVTVTGRVKADRISKAGKPYKSMNYIKRVS